jgi:hypothetical protein
MTDRTRQDWETATQQINQAFELMEMDLGMSDDEQLSAWLGGLPFLSVSPRVAQVGRTDYSDASAARGE